MKLEIIVQEPETAVQRTPVLFIHGMWHGAWCWAENFLPYFAQHGHPAYALSLRGHGTSEGHDRLRWTSLADYVDDIAQVIDKMERVPILIGHSMGGMIIQKYLEAHQVPAAVLMSSVPPKGLLAATLRIAPHHPFIFLKLILSRSPYHVVGTHALCREMLFSTLMPGIEVEKYFSRLQDESFRVYIDMMFLNLPRPEKIDTPMLVMGAENDNSISVSDVEATAKAYGKQSVIFPGMAHDMMLEADWKAVADRILKWLEERGDSF